MNGILEHPILATGGNGRSSHQANGKGDARLKPSAAKPAVEALPRIRPRQPAVDLIRGALRGALARLEATDPEARQGDVEGIHRLRTSTRRLRSELQAVRELVEKDWREHLQQELKWLAGMLGDVRDLDILTNRLRSAIKPAGRNHAKAESNGTASAGPLEPLFLDLRERHDRNSRALREALQGERYHGLMMALKHSISEPAIKENAWEPCRTALPPLVAAAWRRLKGGGRELDQGAADADFHEVRKSAKRVRYTAELIAPALGRRAERRARRFIRLTTKVQDVLGEHQDAIVAAAEIERFLADHPLDDASAQTARDLLETQHQAAQAARSKFFDVWKKLDRKKSVRWFKNKAKASV
ncbi:MAG: CHAD domain-containing protein [Isosphaeraceae bacterium]